MSEEAPDLPPLKITCTQSDCPANLHCFKFHSRRMRPSERGNCRSCGVSLVDWDRIQLQDAGDIDHTLAALKQEFIRHHFWHKPIDEGADKHARRKGRIGLYATTEQRLRTSVGPAEPTRDGRQTPMTGNILYYAQHATASCCRTCIEYWHGIPKGRELTGGEIEYFATLLTRFVAERMPHLRDEPEHIPVRRTSHAARTKASAAQ